MRTLFYLKWRVFFVFLFCFTHIPLIFGNDNGWDLQAAKPISSADLNAVWGSGTDNIYAVGDSGTIIHFDGNDWMLTDSGFSNNFHGVWASNPNEVFVVGSSGTILYFNGDTWSPMTSGTSVKINDIWGTSSTCVFAVCDDGIILPESCTLF